MATPTPQWLVGHEDLEAQWRLARQQLELRTKGCARGCADKQQAQVDVDYKYMLQAEARKRVKEANAKNLRP